MADKPFQIQGPTPEEIQAAPISSNFLEMYESTIRGSLDYRDRNTATDSAVNVLDTLQSIGSIPVAALPGYGLETAAENSQFLAFAVAQ